MSICSLTKLICYVTLVLSSLITASCSDDESVGLIFPSYENITEIHVVFDAAGYQVASKRMKASSIEEPERNKDKIEGVIFEARFAVSNDTEIESLLKLLSMINIQRNRESIFN